MTMKKSKQSLSTDDVKHVATLANLKLKDKKIASFKSELSKIIDYMSKIQALNTEKVAETSQVTGHENVYREDLVEKSRMLTQSQVLSNAQKTYKGYFLIEAIFNS